MTSSFTHPPIVPSLKCIHQGKVRDTFEIPDSPDLLLLVATDRVSTHNIVHNSNVENKGYMLTALTIFWMSYVFSDVETHLVASDKKIYGFLPTDRKYPADLHYRAVVVKKLKMLPVEFIFRSRMAGSLWKSYKKGDENPYGIKLPPSLSLMSEFDDTVFTPTDKSENDNPINSEMIINKYRKAYELALRVYETGREYAREYDIEIIDGKFEIGINSKGGLVLADECLTPDSCRFVDANRIVVGREPDWMDKQFIRAEAERIWNGGGKVPLEFDTRILESTSDRYKKIFYVLTGIK